MPKHLRVAIVGYGYGYGTGGQATALMLSADGHEVDVFHGGNGPHPVASNVQLTSHRLGGPDH